MLKIINKIPCEGINCYYVRTPPNYYPDNPGRHRVGCVVFGQSRLEFWVRGLSILSTQDAGFDGLAARGIAYQRYLQALDSETSKGDIYKTCGSGLGFKRLSSMTRFLEALGSENDMSVFEVMSRVCFMSEHGCALLPCEERIINNKWKGKDK
jgi:hypothetical protein